LRQTKTIKQYHEKTALHSTGSFFKHNTTRHTNMHETCASSTESVANSWQNFPASPEEKFGRWRKKDPAPYLI
jgi:hypothetical protein